MQSIREMNIWLREQCVAGGLHFDCGAGGDFSSEVAIIAEAPGEREVQLKEPLIGGSGKFLWDVLNRDGITRNRVYITNVVKRMLVSASDASNKKSAISKNELHVWQNMLHAELSQLPNLRYIVVLGSYALSALTSYHAISKLRGSVQSILIGGREIKVLCTFNPAHIMREPRLEVVFRMDCARLKRLMTGLYNPPRITAYYNMSYIEATERLCMLEALPHDALIAFDIECMSGETACVGFADTTESGFCINFRSDGNNLYTLEQERWLRLHINQLLSDPCRKFVAQNGMFDSYWLAYRDRIYVNHIWFDTMLAHHTLYPALPHDLAFLTAQYTDQPYYKDEGKEWRSENDIAAFWEYNVKDCCITLAVAHALQRELDDQHINDFFRNHVMRLQPHLVNMTVGGILCDTRLKSDIAIDLKRRLDEARTLCQVQAAVALGVPDRIEFNPRSPRDLQGLFFDKLRLVGRGTSTDRENRQRMRNHSRTSEASRACIDAIDNYLRDAKFISTYVNSRIDEDDRFRCEYKQTGTTKLPGRLSSAGTMWGNGLNLQNIPENAKPMFVADPGYVFSYYDMSQIEARIVAYLASIPAWQHQFELARLNPGTYDAHCALAAEMFGLDLDDHTQVPRHDRNPDGTPTVRYVAKRCRHGLNYRMQPDRLATVTGLSLAEAERAHRLYHRATPQLRVWWNELVELVRRDRRVTTCLGRRWILMERFDDSALDSIVAFEPQSINGDHTASVIYKCQEDARWPRDARMMLNVHDANIAMHRPQDGELVREIMKQYAEAPLYINSVRNRLRGINKPEQLIVPAEFAESKPGDDGIHRWSTLSKIKPTQPKYEANTESAYADASS